MVANVSCGSCDALERGRGGLGGEEEDEASSSSGGEAIIGHRCCTNLTRAVMNISPWSRILSLSHLSSLRNSPAQGKEERASLRS